MKFDERQLANIGLGATLEKQKKYKDALQLYKNEGFGQKYEDLEKKLHARGE